MTQDAYQRRCCSTNTANVSLTKRRQATCLRWRRRADGNPTSVEFIKSRPPHDGQEGLPPAALFLRNDEGAGVGELFTPGPKYM